MTTTIDGPVLASPDTHAPEPQRPRRVRDLRFEDLGILAGSLLAATAATWLLFDQLTQLSGPFGFFLCTVALFFSIYWVVNNQVSGRLVANDRLLTAVVALGAFTLAVPLALMLGFLVVKGWHLISVHLLVHDQIAGPNNAPGLGHAIVGTLEIVAVAIVLGVPAALATAVFLVEVGGRLTGAVRTVVTAMSGLPSIVAGVFIYSIWIVTFHRGFSGFAGAMALAILLLPSVTRTTEEVLKVVPGGLREASMALGAPDWRTTWSVVLPTARPGIVTGIILGVARAVGETAVLLVTIFGSFFWNFNVVHGPQQALPLLVFQNIKSSNQTAIDLAYSAALVLVFLVLVLFVLARLLGRRRGGEDGMRRAPLLMTSELTGMNMPDDET